MAKIAVFVAVTAEIKKGAIPPQLKNHSVEVFYTGMGKVRSAITATETLAQQKWDFAINLGTAGSHRYGVGTLVECGSFVERDVNLSSFGVPPGKFPGANNNFSPLPRRCPDLEFATCGSGDRIDVAPPDVPCDVYDMEAFSIASVCQKYGVPFLCIKYISDSSTEDVFTEWKSNLAKAEVSLLRKFRSFVESLDEPAPKI